MYLFPFFLVGRRGPAAGGVPVRSSFSLPDQLVLGLPRAPSPVVTRATEAWGSSQTLVAKGLWKLSSKKRSRRFVPGPFRAAQLPQIPLATKVGEDIEASKRFSNPTEAPAGLLTGSWGVL